jgi:hypothetical protein
VNAVPCSLVVSTRIRTPMNPATTMIDTKTLPQSFIPDISMLPWFEQIEHAPPKRRREVGAGLGPRWRQGDFRRHRERRHSLASRQRRIERGKQTYPQLLISLVIVST